MIADDKNVFELFIETTPDIVIFHDLNGHIAYVNPAFEYTTGYGPEIIGESVNELMPREATGELHRRRELRREGERGLDRYEVEVMTASRERIPLEVSSTLVARGGESDLVMLIGRDISKRRTAQRALAKSERKYRHLFEQAPTGVFRTNSDGGVLEVNHEMARICGYESPQALIENLTDLASQFYVDPRRRQEFLRSLQATSFVESFEAEAKRADGSRIWVSLSARVAERLYGGRFVIWGFAVDITERKAVMEALREREEDLRITLDAIGDGVVATDARGRVTRMNPVAEKLTGHSAADSAGKDISSVFTVLDGRTRLPVPNPVLRALEEEEPERDADHTVLVSADGKVREISESAARIAGPDGSIVGVVLVFRDVTEQNRMREALRQSEERLQFALEGSRAGVWDWDISSREAYYSPRWCAMLGYEPHEIGNSISEWRDRVHPEDRDLVFQAIHEHIAGRSNFHQSEHRLRCKDGSYRWVLDRGKVVLWGANREPIRMIGTHIDVTERKEKEERSRRINDQLREIMRYTPDMIFVADKDHRLLFTSHALAESVGADEEAVRGKRFPQLVPATDAAFLEEEIDAVFATAEPAHVEHTVETTAGARTFDMAFFPLLGERRETYAVCAIATDITNRRRAQEQVLASLREKEMLLREVHHRVKNNLQIISSLLSLQEDFQDDSRPQSVLRDSIDRVKSMALVHEKLYQSGDFARIQFQDYLSDLASELSIAYAVNPERISIQVDADQVVLGIGSAIPCALIANELVSNALKHAFPTGSGSVDVVMRVDGSNQVHFSVADDGIGYPPELAKMHPSSLGLKLVDQLSNQLGGSVTIETREGATATVCFPMRERDA